MIWKKLSVETSSISDLDLVSAWLISAGVDSIVENEETIDVYFDSDNWEVIQDVLNKKLNDLKFTVHEVKDENWNAVWESSFKPILIDDIYIRASFHEPQSQFEEIIISPKMAFGTGHHETTGMMISVMNKLDFKQLRVLDYGCGTGILSVFALKKGAQDVMAIDIQPEAIENTMEHVQLNNLDESKIHTCQGDLDSLTDQKYDIILANINREVLSINGKNLLNLLKPNGKLLVSGILTKDKDSILTSYEALGFKWVSEQAKGEWSLFHFAKD